MTGNLLSKRTVPFFEGKRVLVTGASGLIGGYVAELLLASGAEVEAVMHDRTPEFSGEVVSNYADLRDLGATMRLFRMATHLDCVLSCAGLTGGVGLTKEDPISYVTLSTTITTNTLHAAAMAKVPLFGFLSSTTVYPPSHLMVEEYKSGFAVRADRWQETCASEGWFGEPYPLYSGIGYSKRFLEQLCAYVSDRTATKCAIVRPSGAYGRFDNFDEKTSHVIPGMINRALSTKDGEDFVIWGDGEDVRDVIHAEDVAYGLLLATAATGEGKTVPATPYNIASGAGITTRELAGAILTKAGRPSSSIVCDTSKLSALKTRRVSIVKAQRELGFEPGISLDIGIEDTIAWRKEQTP